MRKWLPVLGGGAILALVALAGVLAFDAPRPPPPLAAVNDPFKGVDFSDLPPVRTYAARDGARLGYRAYDGGDANLVVLIHGSTDDGSGVHPLAKALREAGASVIAPVMRGHGHSGRKGDIDYIGQLEDDLADLVRAIKPQHPNAGVSLVGFSSGGGFVLRVIGGPDEALFDRFVMISPALPPGAPTNRPQGGGWVSVAIPRIVVLSVLNRLGITGFNGLPVIAFATLPSATFLTSSYSFRLAADFAAPRDYLAALGRSRKPVALLAGGSDELFYADRYRALLAPARPDLRVTIVPGIGHIGMTGAPAGIAAVRQAIAGTDDRMR